MTTAEKRRLGRLVQKLPSKAVDRLAEIIKNRNPATNQNSDTIQVDFEELVNLG